MKVILKYNSTSSFTKGILLYTFLEVYNKKKEGQQYAGESYIRDITCLNKHKYSH